MATIFCEGCGAERPADGAEPREAVHGMGGYVLCRKCVELAPERAQADEALGLTRPRLVRYAVETSGENLNPLMSREVNKPAWVALWGGWTQEADGARAWAHAGEAERYARETLSSSWWEGKWWVAAHPLDRKLIDRKAED